MLTIFRKLAMAALMVLVAVLMVPATATANVDCEVYDPNSGECIITVDPGPGDGGSPSPGDGGGGPGDGGSTTCVSITGVEIPCTGPLGSWHPTRLCYVSLADPQPSQDSDVWEGNESGAIYMCQIAPEDTGLGISHYLFWAESDPGDNTPNPADLAQQAVASMNLTAGQIGTTPPEGSDGLIGLPTWIWVADPGSSTTGPITRTASAGGVTVSATGTLDRIVYQMGDGNTVTCAGSHAPGTPYTESAGVAPSPTCGHTYASAGSYTITAVSYWTIQWSGGGQQGTIPMELSRSVEHRIVEAQSVVTSG